METKSKGLSAWQLTMMALGSVIGGSFFLGSSVAIHAAGPSILLSYILAGVLVYLILYALSEMTVAAPTVGSFSNFAARELGPGFGFVVGWLYWTGTVLSMSSEATAISILLREWFPHLSIAIFGSFLIVGVTLVNLLGADKFGKIVSGLSGVKIFAIIFFIITAIVLITGLLPHKGPIGAGELTRESIMPGGIKGIAGSMLLVVFAYAGFEIIGLAASEARNPRDTIPKAIRYTVFALVGLYILYAIALLPLIPTAALNETVSPMVASLDRWGIGWAGSALNGVLISASLSAMLAAIFGLGRMVRSLVDEGHAPQLLKDNKDVPYRGILFSGLAMLLGLGFGLLFPRVYLVLISTSGFTLIFTYAVIMASHIRFRKREGCPPEGICQVKGFPYTSYIALISLIIVLLSMPLIPGQGTGLVAGIVMLVLFSAIYFVMRYRISTQNKTTVRGGKQPKPGLLTEFSEEITPDKEENKDN
ncbi:amino acid permease [Bacillus sp. AFS076308]|uniref:amino acid permease n=1 Tax=unclassified Bacillus (in: firmicutes) TaxID=185979 RepID=UPI000BF59C28|nr:MULTISPECIES: amino acid permease [unclassified Bacillus (in: firmicutes)]PFO08335.1 amino acid permease [Bacillus sp. AFS076308]PGV50655.1 amino acid permease [Bacillus sp. AFS037270]